MVLDASALLALVNAEPGAEIVAAALAEATIGAVNLAEASASSSTSAFLPPKPGRKP